MNKPTKVTIRTLRARKRGEKTGSDNTSGPFSMLTCYDYSTAAIMEEAGIESLLVGDTYGEVCLGYNSTLAVTLDHLITIAAGVRRGAPSVFLVGDMPFLTYQVSVEEAIRNSGRFMAEADCDCVKIEVDRRHAETVKAITAAGIPVMAHLGLKPQSVNQYGGYVAQGKSAEEALFILEDAKIMEQAGAVALLLEAIPAEVAALITCSTELPVIGCVSGPNCDGQVVVTHDILGYSSGHPPRSVKPYADLRGTLLNAFRSYAQDVGGRKFPIGEQSIHMEATQLDTLRQSLDDQSR